MYGIKVFRHSTGKKREVVFTKEFETRGEAKDYCEGYNRDVFNKAYALNPDYYFIAVYDGGRVFDLYGKKSGYN